MYELQLFITVHFIVVHVIAIRVIVVHVIVICFIVRTEKNLIQFGFGASHEFNGIRAWNSMLQ
jgi:hypothetical protein